MFYDDQREQAEKEGQIILKIIVLDKNLQEFYIMLKIDKNVTLEHVYS